MTKKGIDNNVISKTLAVLRAFTDEQMEWGVNELARYLNFPASSLHRILKILRKENILEISPETGRYKIGAELVRLSSIIYVNVDIKSIARPFIQRLSEQFNESVYLALYYSQHKKIAFVDRVLSSNALKYVLELGVLQPVHVASSGKVIMAFLEKEEIEAIFREVNITGDERAILERELEKIRKQGYAMTANERKLGALSIGAPLFNASNKVFGSIICVIPVNSFDDSKKDIMIKNVKETAQHISYNLGYQTT